MVTVPFSLFFLVSNNQYLLENYGYRKANSIAAVCAVGGVQFVIYVIIIVKYWEDFMIVLRGEGHKPYDESMKETAEYFQSE